MYLYDLIMAESVEGCFGLLIDRDSILIGIQAIGRREARYQVSDIVMDWSGANPIGQSIRQRRVALKKAEYNMYESFENLSRWPSYPSM